MGLDISAYDYIKESTFRPETEDIYDALSEFESEATFLYISVSDLPRVKKRVCKSDYKEIEKIVKQQDGCYFNICY